MEKVEKKNMCFCENCTASILKNEIPMKKYSFFDSDNFFPGDRGDGKTEQMFAFAVLLFIFFLVVRFGVVPFIG